jgi:hypothetical protein
MSISTTAHLSKPILAPALIIGHRDDGWFFFDRGDDHACYPWRSLRLVNPSLKRGKRSYWLGWSHQEQRFARNADMKALAKNTELLGWVQSVGGVYFDTLPDQ